MNSVLSLTQRQMCEKLAERMNKNNVQAAGLQAFIIKLIADDYATISIDELIDYGIINDNLSLNPISWMTDSVIAGQLLQSSYMKFTHINDTYHNLREFTTISNAINGATLAEYFGVPVGDYVHEKGCRTIVEALKRDFDFGSLGLVTDLGVYIGIEWTPICHLDINGDLVTITDVNDQLVSVLNEISVVVAGTQMITDLCQSLSDGLHSPADLFAILQHYTQSTCSSIATFARNILRKGRDTIRTAIFEIISLFRQTFGNYSEDGDGHITWDIESHPVSTNFWLVAGNILIGGAQAIGAMLLMSGVIITKIIGGLITIGTTIVQAISTFTGTITGTTPLICEDAIDPCYHDPIAQCDGQSLQGFLMHEDLASTLNDYRRCKIITNCYTLYIYNYNPVDNTCDWKLFANMTHQCPGTNSFWSNTDYLHDTIKFEQDMNYAGTSLGTMRSGCGFFTSFFDRSVTRNWAFSLDGNHYNNIIWSPSYLQGENESMDMSDLNSYILDSNDKSYSSSTNQLSIATSSGNAGNWKRCWHTLRSNIIQTLIYVFCNTTFYSANVPGMQAISHGYPGSYTMLDDIVYYDQYNGAPGYADMINAIILLGQVDHSQDYFLMSLLSSAGLLNNQPPSVTVTEKKFSLDSSSDLVVENVSLHDFSTVKPMMYEDYTGLFPFMSIDTYAYVTPPETDFKSVIFGALIASALVIGTVIAIKVVRSKIAKRLSTSMQNKGQQLLQEGQTYRDAFQNGSYDDMEPADRKQFYSDYKKYLLKVNLYNTAAGLLGLSSLDWVNNWWNPYEPKAGGMVSPVTTELNGDTIAAVKDTVDSVGSLYRYAEDPQGYSDMKTDALILYHLISGRYPSQD